MYPESAPFPVFDNDVWWGDSWDGRDYGRDFDFERSFFEQMKELNNEVPHYALAVLQATMQNSEFCNHAGYLKNSYLIYNSDYAERCMYSKGVNRCFDCLDCFKVYDSEACYECMNSYNCQFCTYVWDSHNSSECDFSYNLIGCQNCFMCVNLQNQEYCFKNEKMSKDQWEEKVEEVRNDNSFEDTFKQFIEFKSQFPHKWMNEMNTEDCTGDYLVNCNDCEGCFDCEYLEKSKYCTDLKKGDEVSYQNQDITAFGLGVIDCYEGGTVGYNANHCLFGDNVWESFDTHCSMICPSNCKHCFGCVGLKRAEYCILNKQYTKEEYEELVPKIIEHMKKNGEWGEFFPIENSPFGYNETVANEYFPMFKEEVKTKGWSWKEKDNREYQKQTYIVPENIEDIEDSICDEILACEITGKNYKIQDTELQFYRKMDLPIPRYCPDARHLKRLGYRNPRVLNDRKCMECGVELKSTYLKERPEIYCHKCFLNKTY